LAELFERYLAYRCPRHVRPLRFDPSVRRNDMRRLLLATNGTVFTLSSIERLVAHTRIRDFVTRPIPGDMK
jgi:hypothetical protein